MTESPTIQNAAPLLRDRYEPQERLGIGGQGEVIRAWDHLHGRNVALKLRDVGTDETREALLAEAQTLLRLRPHPCLPLFRDDFFIGDRYVIVMDWVEGCSLDRILAERGDPGLAPSVVLSWLVSVAAALDHLHSHDPPIVHGDVKPANVVLTPDNRVVLVDFGLAGPQGVAPGGGTRGYVAPEVATGCSPTSAADIYGLAATAVALLTGSPPTGVRATWEGVAPALAGPLERSLRRALAPDPAQRPSSAGELLERMQSFFHGALPTGVVTFCLTDIEGSTRLWDANPVAMAEALAEHDMLVADAVEFCAGHLVKAQGEGDSTLSVFTRASDAVRCALLLQQVMGQRQWPGDLELSVRVALHAGEAQLREGDYFGPSVNRAARLRSLARGGQTLLSRAAAELVTDTLAPGVQLFELGERELRFVPTRAGLRARCPDPTCPLRFRDSGSAQAF